MRGDKIILANTNRLQDFRSDDGLYNMVKKQYPNVVVRGKDLFDAVLFSSPDTIQVFFTFMSYLRDCILNANSTQTHKLLKLLKEKKKLLRCYTQNIDGLEAHEGLETGITPKNWKKLDVIQLHGDIHKLKCMHCSSLFDWSEESSKVCQRGEAPECPSCRIVQEDRLKRNRRSTGIGRLKPNIVLYGEEHPDGDLIGRCTQSDFKAKPDFLLIAGTSLKVMGIQKLVRQAAKSVKERGGIVIFVNKTEVGTNSWKDIIDFHIEADCDDWVSNLKTRVPDFFSIQTKITNFAKAKSDAKKRAKEVEKIITPPSTPVKSRSRVAPSSRSKSIEYVDVDGGEDVPLTPPSSRRRARVTAKGGRENRDPAMVSLPTPEKTPKRRAFEEIGNPLEKWDANLENGARRKRVRGTFSSMDNEFEAIKRPRKSAC